MNKCISTYKIGFDDGIKDALEDYLNKKNKNINNNYDKDTLSKIYDVGYKNGYITFNDIIKNNLYFNRKI